MAGAGNRTRRSHHTAGIQCCRTRPSWTAAAAAVASSAVGEPGEDDLTSQNLLCMNQNSCHMFKSRYLRSNLQPAVLMLKCTLLLLLRSLLLLLLLLLSSPGEVALALPAPLAHVVGPGGMPGGPGHVRPHVGHRRRRRGQRQRSCL